MNNTIKERPILFSGPMVRAILEGRKTQTRRVMKPQPELLKDGKVWKWSSKGFEFASVVIPPSTQLLLRAQGKPGGPVKCLCPYGAPGDRLWVRETSVIHEGRVWYRESGVLPVIPDVQWKWTPSIHMPRWASRVTLEIVSVRVEQLQEISDQEIRAEGFTDTDATPTCIATAEQYGVSVLRHRFSCLWEKINGAGSWIANPWVWAVEFKRVEVAN